MQLPTIWRGAVLPEWIDRNGHMNAGFYMVVFDMDVKHPFNEKVRTPFGEYVAENILRAAKGNGGNANKAATSN